MYTLEGVNCVANFITAYEESQYNRDFNFFIYVMCSLFPNAIVWIFIDINYQTCIYALRVTAVVQLLVFIYSGTQ